MRDLLLVGTGGFLGAVARYALTLLVARGASPARFPLATLVVNISGCLAIGILAGLGERTNLMTPGSRLFLMTGLLGGYTTFSAFALETFLAREHGSLVVLNVVAQVGLGLLAVVVGYRLASVGAA